MRRSVPAVLALVLTACATPAQSAENLAARVAAAPDGTVGFSYTARANICGDGGSFIVEFVGPDQQNVYTSQGTTITNNFGNDDWRMRCSEGPVRIVLTKRNGQVVDLYPSVGGSERVRAVRTDLGTVAPQEAADYLLDLARRMPDIASDAFMAASLGEGARISVALLEHARDQRVTASVRESAVKWIGRTVEREGTADQVLPGLRGIATNSNEQSNVRERAVRAIGQFPRGDVELRSLYPRLDVTSLRERAIRVFAEVGGNSNTAFIKRVALDSNEDSGVRERAVRVLGEELGRLDVVRELYPQLNESQLRQRAVRSVAEHLTSESAQWIRGIAENENEDHDIRDRAVRTLGEAGYIGQLRTMYARLQDQDLKERIVRVAGEHGSADDMRWLEKIVLNEREAHDLRDRALRVSAEHELATTRLVSIFDEIESHDLRERVLRLLGERADEAAVNKLISVARTNADADLRRRAVKLLAESDHPSAREFLRNTVIK